MLRSLLIIIAVILVAATAAFVTADRVNFGHSRLNAMSHALHKGNRGSAALFGAPSGVSFDQEEATPGDEGEAAEEPPADDGNGAAAGDEEGNGGDESTEGDEGAAGGDESAEGDEGTEAGDESAEGDEGAEAGDESAAGDEEAAEGDEAAEDEEAAGEEEEASSDPIENFKNLDPRDIIVKKYEDLESRLTEPWNPESEDYIPNTGRVDPLTRVSEAVPDDLKPPRTGESDMNEILTYLVTAQASEAVDMISAGLQCHNVIQIGLQRFATFTFFGQQFSRSEGDSLSFPFGYENGIQIIAQVTVTSISTTKVVVNITAFGQGTTTSVTKTKVFIPSQYE